MNIISKDDNLAWGCYLLLGFLGLLFLPGIFLEILWLDISVFIRVPAAILLSAATLYAYKKYLGWYVEDGASLSVYGQVRKVGIGWLVSMLHFVLMMSCFYLAWHYSIVGANFNIESQLNWFSILLPAAIIEEVTLRGIVFRMIADKWNVAVGLVVSSLTFGFIHILNPECTVWSCLEIAVTAGWLMGIAYAYHRTLWVPIGIHWAYNFLIGCFFGHYAPDTALDNSPIFISCVEGLEFMPGGKYEIEGTIVNLIISVTISLVYTLLYIKKRRNRKGEDNDLWAY